MSWIRGVITTYSQDQTELRRFELAIEEALVNVIHYAYPRVGGLIEISYEYQPSSRYLNITIKDQGLPFNPLEDKKRVDTTSSIDERTVGGLGIHFMREITDSIHYQRESNSNILTLSKEVARSS